MTLQAYAILEYDVELDTFVKDLKKTWRFTSITKLHTYLDVYVCFSKT